MFKLEFLKVFGFYLRWYFRETGFVGWYIVLRDFFNSFSVFLFSFLTTKVLDILVVALKEEWDFLFFWERAQVYLLSFSFLLFLSWFFSFSGQVVDQLREREALYLSFLNLFVEKVFSLEHSQLEDPKIQNLVVKTWDAEFWPMRVLVRDTISLLINLGSLLFFVSFLSAVSSLGVYFLPVVVMVTLEAFLKLKETQLWYKNYERTNEERKISYELYPMLANFSLLWEAKLSRAFEFIKRRYSEVLEKAVRGVYEGILRLGVIGYAIRFLRMIFLVFFYYKLLQLVLIRELTIGQFAFFVTTTPSFISLLNSVFYSFSDAYNTYLKSRFFFEFYHLPTRDPKKGISLSSYEKVEITLRDVWFKYPGSQKWAIRGVSFRISPGGKVALVGENGAGKSTLLKLILGFYKPQRGEVLLNGIPSWQVKREDIWKVFRVLPQDFTRYGIFSVRENIGLVEPENLGDTERIKRAAQKSGIWEFARSLPRGFNTPLTKKLEGGVELSTGQWQKIALARIFFKRGSVVILDEPTSALDPISEREIFGHLAQELKDKTLIVVSHRYFTVQDMEKIFVLKEGQIIEQGTHEELLKKQGYYYKAWKASVGKST